MDLALNNLQRLICHKTKQTKPKNQDFFLAAFMPYSYSGLHSVLLLLWWDYLNRSSPRGHLPVWPLWDSKTQDWLLTIVTAVGYRPHLGSTRRTLSVTEWILIWLQDWDWLLQESPYLLWAVYISFHNAHVFWLSPTLFTQLEHQALSKVNMQHFS